MPKVSVVIPTYNRSALLLKAIESVLQQTFKDYELIVIDDGSTDDTRERLEPYMDRIQYFYQANKGASAAQNLGVKAAKGEWVAILASDDAWLPKKLEKQLEALGTLGREFGACFTNGIYTGNPALSKTVFEDAGLTTNAPFGPFNNVIPNVVKKKCLIYVQSLLVLRSLVNEIGGFDEALDFVEDADLIFRLSFKTRFCFVSEPLVYIDRSPDIKRLTGTLVHMSDRAFASFERFSKKAISAPELVNHDVRLTIYDNLIGLYYHWAATRLRQLRLIAAMQSINTIRSMGHSYRKIVRIMLVRAGKMVSRRILRQTIAS